MTGKLQSKSKSLYIKRPDDIINDSAISLNYLTTIKTNSRYFINDNNGLINISRKPSIKHKLLSIFKSNSRNSHSVQGSYSYAIDENLKYLSNMDNSECETSRPLLNSATVRTVNNKKPTTQKSRSLIEHTSTMIERLDGKDKLLLDISDLHSLNHQIIRYIAEIPKSTISISSSWIRKMGTHLSNSVVIPFLSVVPGSNGIDNHGNTCYVNVIVQCLAHIDGVAEYLSTKDYLKHALPISDLSQNDSITGFNVLVGFSFLIQVLWQIIYHSKISLKFCQLLKLHKLEFSTDSQQDAHEFLLFMLNLLHERTKQKQISQESKNRKFEETSYIYDLFRSWLVNEITCPECGFKRKSRDLMLSLNLQIPKLVGNDGHDNCLTNNLVFYTIVINGSKTPMKHAIEVNQYTTIGDIRRMISVRLRFHVSDVIVLELNDNGFGDIYLDSEQLLPICQNRKYTESCTFDRFGNGLYVVYIPSQVVDVDALPIDNANDSDNEKLMKNRADIVDTQTFIRILIVHIERNRESLNDNNDEIRFENPYHSGRSKFQRFTNVLAVQASRKTSFTLLWHSLKDQMCKSLNLRNVGKLPKPKFILEMCHRFSETDQFPLSHPSVLKALKHNMAVCGDESGFVRLTVIWPFRTTQVLRRNKKNDCDCAQTERPLLLLPDKVPSHPSVEELTVKYENFKSQQNPESDDIFHSMSISDCLKDFFSPDTLSTTDSWKCPECQTRQPARTENRLQHAPPIMIIMLKRFTKNNHSANRENIDGLHPSKSDTMLELKDGSSRKSSHSKSDESLNKLNCLIEYPLNNLDIKPYMEVTNDNDNYLYDLIGVVNHKGNLFNGHYVAICQNSIDHKWRLYDDDRVVEISETDVVRSDAYILFYERQQRKYSDLNLHWSYRRLTFPDNHLRNQNTSPTSVYSKTVGSRSSSTSLSKDVATSINKDYYQTLPITMTNNQNNKSHHHFSDVPSSTIQTADSCIVSPLLSSSCSSLSRVDIPQPSVPMMSPSLLNDDIENFIDLSNIDSEVVFVDAHNPSCNFNNNSNRKPSSSITSTSDSLQQDSGAILSYDNSLTFQQFHNDTSVERDECYNSFSSSTSTSPTNAVNSASNNKYHN